METLVAIEGWLAHPVFTVGGTTLTVGKLLTILLLLIVMIWISRKIRDAVVHRLTRQDRVHPGVAEALGSIVRYGVVAVTLAALASTLGINLSSVMVVAGVLGLGIGLGLQRLVNDFVSGLVLLVERPIKVGDRVELGEMPEMSSGSRHALRRSGPTTTSP